MLQTIKGIMKNKKGKSSKCEFVHVGKMVDIEIYRHGIGKKEFAFRVEIDRSNLYRILKKESLATDQLFRFSVELGHNFFRDLADEFDIRHQTASKTSNK